jgi:SAM-dependent methyltransferase
MEQIKFICYFCGSPKNPTDLETHVDNGNEYKLHECLNCHVQYWTPFENPGAQWYEKDLRYAGRNIDPDIEPNWHQKKTIVFLNPLKGKLLDVGCGAGTFMYWARKNGWDVSGIDFDRNAIRTGKEVFKLDNIEDTDLGGYLKKYPSSDFNLVTFFDVFEHIDNHNEFLSQIKSSLVPGGYIALSTPYRRGARWLQSNDLPPRHLSRWDRSTITDYLDRRGFKVVYVRRLSEGIGFMVTKLRRKYGKYVSLNIVGKLKNKVRKDGKIELGSSVEKNISRVHKLARAKDWIVFGIPAILIWLATLFTSKRYITLFIIAQKKEDHAIL